MKIKLTPELTKALNKSITMARDNRHEYITLEHILFALLNEPTASRLLREVGVNVKKLEVISVNESKNQLLVKGSVPGAANGIVYITR